MLWKYFWLSERGTLMVFVFGTLATTIGLFWQRAAIAEVSRDAGQQLASRRRSTWYALTFAVFSLIAVLVGLDRSDMRRFRSIDRLAHRTNPLVTLVVSVGESVFDEPIHDCLEDADLVAMDTYRWRPPDDAARPVGAAKPISIIFIAVESLRSDVVHQRPAGRAVTPTMHQLATDGIEFTNAYSQSTHSDYADVAVLSSLYPLRTRRHHYYRRSDPWPKTLLYELLKQGGYATAIISAQNEKWGGMDAFLESPQLDLFYDAERSGQSTHRPAIDYGFSTEVAAGVLTSGKLDDRIVTDQALAWMAEQIAKEQPYFVSINFQSSHFPYALPPNCERPFQPCEIDFDASFMHYPPEKTEIVRNAYWNSLVLIDAQVDRIVSSLRRQGTLDETLIVLYGENGEAFHENGLVTHAKQPIEPAVHVPCVMFCPSLFGPREESYPFELIDVAPTVLGLMHWPAHANFQGMDVLSDQRPSLDNRCLFLHTELQGVSRVDAILWAGRWKLFYDRESGRHGLFDLANDRQESRNLLHVQPEMADKLTEMLLEWRHKQLAYYHFPYYYANFFPPSYTWSQTP